MKKVFRSIFLATAAALLVTSASRPVPGGASAGAAGEFL